MSVVDRIVIDAKKVIRNVEYTFWKNKLLNYSQNKRIKTSSSDNELYPRYCQMAASEDTVFSSFRKNVIYNEILEHVSKKDGQAYLDAIADHAGSKKYDIAAWKMFLLNDQYGNPRAYKYNICGEKMLASPTTLRYVRIMQDIYNLIDMSNVKNCVEIGIGYGGQCRLLTAYSSTIQRYTLYDLPEVLQLAKKYLSKYEISSELIMIDGTQNTIDSYDYDLVISNYAFSELIKEVQDYYLENVILKSKHGYIIWNTLSYKESDGYSKDELLNMIPGSREEKEIPLSSEGNCVIVW